MLPAVEIMINIVGSSQYVGVCLLLSALMPWHYTSLWHRATDYILPPFDRCDASVVINLHLGVGTDQVCCVSSKSCHHYWDEVAELCMFIAQLSKINWRQNNWRIFSSYITSRILQITRSQIIIKTLQGLFTIKTNMAPFSTRDRKSQTECLRETWIRDTSSRQ